MLHQIITNAKTKNMKTLTAKQLDLFKTLVRLGDSKKIALKTVLKQKANESTQIYQTAYYS